MGRARILKPEFFTDSSVVRCSPLARLLFAGSWCFADDNGIIPDDMLQLKMQVLPGDTINADALKHELIAAGLWVRYEVDGRSFILIRRFCSHQTLSRPVALWPLPDAETVAKIGCAVVPKTYTKHDQVRTVQCLVFVRSCPDMTGTGPDTAGSSPDSRRAPRKEDEQKGKGKGKGKKARAENSELVAAFVSEWNALGEPFATIRELGTRQADLDTRLSEPFFRANWKAALEKMRGLPFCRGENDRGWVADVEFFLRPDKVIKILEGKYDRLGNGTRQSQQDKKPEFSKTEW